MYLEVVDDFVVYWLPQMTGSDYNLISFVGFEEDDIYNQKFGLDLVNASGDSVGEMFRVIMVWKPVSEMVQVKEQVLPVFERPNVMPYVVEWGGVKLD